MANAALTAGTRVLYHIRPNHARDGDTQYTPQKRITTVGNVQKGVEESHLAGNYLAFGGERSFDHTWVGTEALMWLYSEMFHKAKSARQPYGMYMTTFCTFRAGKSDPGSRFVRSPFSLVERLSPA